MLKGGRVANPIAPQSFQKTTSSHIHGSETSDLGSIPTHLQLPCNTRMATKMMAFHIGERMFLVASLCQA